MCVKATWLRLGAPGTLADFPRHTPGRLAPVCGVDYWRVVVTSPEVLIFLFFMITDPRTIPASGAARIVFGVLVAIVSTLLMAPQTDEFGAKVGLLAGLVVVCAARPLLDRWLPKALVTERSDPLSATNLRCPAGSGSPAG